LLPIGSANDAGDRNESIALSPGELMKSNHFILGLIMILVIVSLALEAPARPKTQVKTEPQTVSRLPQLLEGSGYPYRKAGDNVWAVTFKGTFLTEMNVFITSAGKLVIIGAVVAQKKSMRLNSEATSKLLRLAYDLDQVKIGFDKDEDLFLRAELSLKCLDVDDFKAILEQVFVGVERAHETIKPYLVK
jgi:hypothetical protein